MKRSEKSLEIALIRKVKLLNGFCVKQQFTGQSGFPDRIVVLPFGVFWFVELKREGKKLSKLQEHWKIKLKSMGYNFYVIDSQVKLKLFFGLIQTT